ncbi:hypothetical protein [Pseudactinotalea sp.]|uniref:hypothetical protein n=1 Tax=Pseudactinotalea sp. TaxID=1926260 RepID=UPI003B3BAD5B
MRSTTTPPKGGSSPQRGTSQRAKARPGASQARGKPRPAAGKSGASAAGPRGASGAAKATSTARNAAGARSQARRGPRTPQGSGTATQQDKARFRRRRLTVLTILLVLVAGIVVGVRAGVNALAAADDMLPRPISDTPVVPPDPDDAPTGPPTEEELANPVDCRPAAIELTLDMPNSVKEGAATAIPVTVTNTGQVPCLADVGSRIQLVIYSGDDQVWTSQHCSNAGERRVLLDIDGEDSASFRWNGSRSASGCPDQAVAKAGTYRAVVMLLGGGEDPATIAETEATFTVK